MNEVYFSVRVEQPTNFYHDKKDDGEVNAICKKIIINFLNILNFQKLLKVLFKFFLFDEFQ